MTRTLNTSKYYIVNLEGPISLNIWNPGNLNKLDGFQLLMEHYVVRIVPWSLLNNTSFYFRPPCFYIREPGYDYATVIKSNKIVHFNLENTLCRSWTNTSNIDQFSRIYNVDRM